jgi:DNA-3-methyladenine glycosylase I
VNDPRCSWCLGSPEYIAYHDDEWGKPVHDDRTFFEFLVLEGAQAGLSWSTILAKRGNYRKAFAQFDPVKVARFTPAKVKQLLQDPGIVRNRLKVEGTVRNAKAFLAVQKEFGSFDKYVWRFVGGKPKANKPKSLKNVPATSPESDALSKDLKKRGFTFVGPTIVYAYLQSTGVVNDHVVSCFRYAEV